MAHHQMTSRSIVVALITALGLGIGAGSYAASGNGAANSASCRAAAPAALTAQPARWLGQCVNGAAEGAGTMRAGTAEPYQFFFGEMHAGLPVRGIMKEADGWEMATSFDASRAGVVKRSMEGSESHEMFVLAARAARVTAQIFSSQGNRSSAAYYERLAQQITDGEPE
jgi:hypothetical protein